MFNPKVHFMHFKIEQNKFNSDKEFVLELLKQKGYSPFMVLDLVNNMEVVILELSICQKWKY